MLYVIHRAISIFVMNRVYRTAALLSVLSTLISACTSSAEAPTASPTPETLAIATPLPRVELKRDAELEAEIAKIAEEARGKVGVAAVVLETGEAAFLNADQRFPMQSVYKLPISMAVMEQVRLGKLDLDEKVAVTKEDFVREGMASPLRDKNPNGGKFTIRDLIRLALVESDGTASDVLMRVAGGAGEIQNYLTQIGVDDMKVVNTEKEIGRDWETQYDNWATPVAAVELLRSMREWTPDGDNKELLLHQFMRDSKPGARRLKGLIPKGTTVIHKTGTSGTRNGFTAATNDIGLIFGPNRRAFAIAIAVFVSDSPADERTRDAVIAKIARAAWDRWNK